MAVIKKISTNNVGVRSFALSPGSMWVSIVDLCGDVFIHCMDYHYDLKRCGPTIQVRTHDLVSMHARIVDMAVSRGLDTVGCKLSWYPQQYQQQQQKMGAVAVPSSKGCIAVFHPRPSDSDSETKRDSNNWQVSFLMGGVDDGSYHSVSCAINITSFSPDGTLLLSADMLGNILIWRYDASSPESSTRLKVMNRSGCSDTCCSGSPFRDVAWGSTTVDVVDVVDVVDNVIKLAAFNDEVFLEFDYNYDQSTAAAAGEDTCSNTQWSLTAASQVQPSTEKGNINIDVDVDVTDEDVFGTTDLDLAEIDRLESAYYQQLEPIALPSSSASIVEDKDLPPSLPLVERPGDRSNAAIDRHADNNNNTTTRPVVVPSSPEVKRRLTKNKSVQFRDDDVVVRGRDDDDDEYGDEVVPVTAIAQGSAPTPSSRRPVVADSYSDFDDDYNDDADAGFDSVSDERVSQAYGAVEEGIKLPISSGSGSRGGVRSVQRSFQPSSTAFDERDRRYMVWNHVGSIVLRKESIGNRIEFRFTNTGGSNRNESIVDHLGYVMGSLAFEGAVFASEPEVDEDRYSVSLSLRDRESRKAPPGSTIYYYAFAGQKQLLGVNESFQWTLSDGEAALAVAVGQGWLAVATSRCLLYVYSSTGLLCLVTSLPGVVVSMCGSDSLLAVFYHSSRLEVDLLAIDWRTGCKVKKLVTGVPLPSPPVNLDTAYSYSNSKDKFVQQSEQSLLLEWVGFDVDNGLLMMLDSQDMLWCLISGGVDWHWMPVLNIALSRKDINHIFWPVTVKQKKLVYVQLNGESKPAIHPQPVVHIKGLKVPAPLMRNGKPISESAKEKTHNIIWDSAVAEHMQSVAHHHVAAASCEVDIEDKIRQLQIDADRAVAKALQDACQLQQIPQALNYALQLRTEKALDVAMQVANHFGRSVVAELLDDLLQRKREDSAAAVAASQWVEEAAGHEVNSSIADDCNHYSNNSYGDVAEESSSHSIYLENSLSSKRLPSSSLPFNGTLRHPSSTASRVVVSPAMYEIDRNDRNDDDVIADSSSNKPPMKRNPFAKPVVTAAGTTTSPSQKKRKSVFEGIQDLKASPSPKKVPSLNVSYLSLYFYSLQYTIYNSSFHYQSIALLYYSDKVHSPNGLACSS